MNRHLPFECLINLAMLEWIQTREGKQHLREVFEGRVATYDDIYAVPAFQAYFERGIQQSVSAGYVHRTLDGILFLEHPYRRN